MKISVIVPSYKPGGYLWECLDSLKQQTLNSAAFEVIIVLNGCCEPWKSQISDYIKANKLTNFRLLQTNEGGVSNARNIGLDNAKGEYITFIDDDDFISPTYLQSLLDVSSPNCVALTDSIYFDDETRQNNYDNLHHNEYQKLKGCLNPSLYKVRRFFNGPVMKLLHRDIIGSRRFDRRFSNGEDSLFMALISDRIKSCKFCPPNAVYYRRIRAESATTRKRPFHKRIANSLNAIAQYSKYWIRRPLNYKAAFMSSRIIAQIKNIILK